MAQRIVIMAGGTGGHVFPALAVAQHLREQDWQVSWLGTQQGLESRVVPEHGIELDWLSVAGFRGKGLLAKIKAVGGVLRACWQARRVLQQRKPDVVLGMGGFVAGPGGLMARIMGIPLVIHEQNRIPGTTNRLLAKFANTVIEAFTGSFKANVKAVCTGNPLRKSLLHLNTEKNWDLSREFRVLIIGGSQGAAFLNNALPSALAQLTHVAIKHQTGAAMQAEVQKHYQQLGVSAEVLAFVQDMETAYTWADMLICRAGAMTISELAAAGLPAILVPLPNAIDNHQLANAQVLAEAGAALIAQQQDLTDSTLLRDIQYIQTHYTTMAYQAKTVARIDATHQVAELCKMQARS